MERAREAADDGRLLSGHGDTPEEREVRHNSEPTTLRRISYAVFPFKQKIPDA